ncbi:MAG: AAA family ATPase [Eubacterium sp.]|uniref:ATP-binding protein n=1 Tax=Candidatus Weimeria bifida TaxID=2599074 RepID=A0A6N7J1L4_9FIRM|nr:AAA family ATPase [Eubacterium sp.]MQN01709.1 ATP-binding protein [Candidatus Weimeria bifida]RRF94748.1 MAG: ATP-binding protein [Lachnospiraceae bacterium]
MYREIIKDLIKWKNNNRRKPLILTGVRQCGKTYIVEEFGRNNFSNLVVVNFEQDRSVSALFDYDFDVNRIVTEISRLKKADIIPGQTLLFFDEIQECPKAVTALKYFCEDLRGLHLIAAGSLLGVALTHKNISFPVGKVNRMQLYPMNFKEFAIACGEENFIQTLSDWPFDREIPDLYSVPMKKLLDDYYIVGGMPEAVKVWSETHDYDEVTDVQNEILNDYESDFAKHAPLSEVPKIKMIWNSVPVQLARENNKFVFSHVKEGKRSADLEDALEWLIDAGIIYKLCLVEKPELPLSGFANYSYFKVYLCDLGLLRVRSGLSPKTIINGSGSFIRYKGAMAENFVYEELVSIGKSPYFWRSGNTAELDFIYDGDDSVVPVEVKAADNTQAKSYRIFCKKYSPQTGFKISRKNIAENFCENTRTINLPMYMTWNIKRYE